MLKSIHIPYVMDTQAKTSESGLHIDKAVTDGTTHYLEVSYVHSLPTPYSISAVSPIRRGLFDHEIFVGKKMGLAMHSAGWKIWMPAMYPSVEIRIGTGPLEFAIKRIEINNLSRGNVPPNPVIVPAIYMKESNVPKTFPGELRRFAPTGPQPKYGVCFDYWVVKEWNGAYYYCFSVVNNLPLPNISFKIKATCNTQAGQEIDRQFFFSRDEIVAITPCRPTKFLLRLITLPQVGLGKLGFKGASKFGPVADEFEY